MNVQELLLECEPEFQSVLQLKHDWDEEGAEPTTIQIVDSAKKFLTEHFEYMKNLLDVDLQVPDISLYTKGTIDLHWSEKDYELLINISEISAGYYGRTFHPKEFEIKGTIPL